jgi:TRAP-type mannitol/chloroaromatic compound transport system substrate-binding protein
MNRRKALITAGGGGLAAILAANAAPAFAQGKKEWRLQCTWPKNAPGLATGAIALSEFVNKATNGSLTIRLFSAGEITPPFQTLEAVANGTIQMGQGYATYWAGQAPAVQFLGPLPFGLTSQEQMAWLYYGGGAELASKVYEKMGVVMFPNGQTSVQSAGWYNREINSLNDYKGLKMRVGGLGGKVLQALGGTPVAMPLGEVPQAMQSGAIDAIEFVGPMNDMGFGLHKLGKYYYWPGWLEPSGQYDCFVNPKAWETLSPAEKEIIRAGNVYASQLALSELVAKNAAAWNQLVNVHKVQVKKFSDDTLKGLGETAWKVIEAEAQKDPMSKEVFASIMKFRAEVLPYTNISEMEFMRSRNLGFKFG